MTGLKLLLFVGWFMAIPVSEKQSDSAEVVKVVASADRNQVQIADPFEFEILVTAPRGTTISLPEFEKKIGAFDIVDVGETLQSADEQDLQQQTWTRKFVLETIESGDLEIPTLEVSVTDDEGSRILRTEPLKISVASLVEANADLTKFNDIAGLIDVDEPASERGNLVWIVAAASLALVVASACLWFATRCPEFESAAVWALGKLDRIDGDFAQVEVILRGFLEEKLELPAASLGAAALVGELERRRFDQNQIADLDEILAVSERVKFGGLQLSEQQNAHLNNSARDLISQLGEMDLATIDETEAV